MKRGHWEQFSWKRLGDKTIDKMTSLPAQVLNFVKVMKHGSCQRLTSKEYGRYKWAENQLEFQEKNIHAYECIHVCCGEIKKKGPPYMKRSILRLAILGVTCCRKTGPGE